VVILSLHKVYGEFVNYCYSLSFSEVHMSWILLVIATKEDNINPKKSVKNYRFRQCQQIVLT
jgi:hypothetical protein